MEKFDLELEKTSKVYRRIKDAKWRLLLNNHNDNNNLDSDFFLSFVKLHGMYNKIRYKNNAQMQVKKKSSKNGKVIKKKYIK